MIRVIKITWAGVLSLFFIVSFYSCSEKKDKKPMAQMNKPNVLLILTDDQAYGDLSFTDNPISETPHLDRLAKEGVFFENFYVSPVCAPTRASLLTGRYHQRTGVQGVTRGRENMNLNEVIANRTHVIQGNKLGEGDRFIHPNDDVNKSQSSNDTFPTAMHIAAYKLIIENTIPALELLKSTFEEKQTFFKRFWERRDPNPKYSDGNALNEEIKTPGEFQYAEINIEGKFLWGRLGT